MRFSRLLKNTHLRRYPARSPSRGRARSCSLFVATAPLTLPQDGVYPELVEGGALHLGIFEQPVENDFFSKLLWNHLDEDSIESEGGKSVYVFPWMRSFESVLFAISAVCLAIRETTMAVSSKIPL